MAKTYDPKCYDLAGVFLSDMGALNDALIEAHRMLASKSAQYVAERQKVERLRNALGRITDLNQTDDGGWPIANLADAVEIARTTLSQET